MTIHQAINEAMRDIARIGIGKTQKNTQQGYHFRGIEQAMNELSPIMVNHGITVAPSFDGLTTEERKTEKGGTLRFATLRGTFQFFANDGSSVTCTAYGEAMDSGDKAVIKAQSVAFRTALFQLFVVPTMSMDTELDDHAPAAPEDVALLDNFRACAMAGTAALRARYDADPPSGAFWEREGPALKKAAAQADKDAKAKGVQP